MKKIRDGANFRAGLINQLDIFRDAARGHGAELFFLIENVRGIHRDADDQLADAVVEFASDAAAFGVLNVQELGGDFSVFASFFGALAVGDVAGDFGGADNAAGVVFYRRNGQGNIEELAILSACGWFRNGLRVRRCEDAGECGVLRRGGRGE